MRRKVKQVAGNLAANSVIDRFKHGLVLREYFTDTKGYVLHAWLANQPGHLEFIEIEWKTKELYGR